MGDVIVLSSLRTLAVSAVALAVAAGAGVTLATVPATSVEVVAVPAAASASTAPRDAAREEVDSRSAEREALDAALATAVEQRAGTLAATDTAIDATEQAIQAVRAAEARAAAEAKAAEERAAAEAKAAADRAAAKAAEERAALLARGGNAAMNRELGRQLAQNLYGWGSSQFTCYDNIIMRESRWIATADNPTSSAYGIPQALPGSRMASEGPDWKLNPETQIRWGLKYVKERYGTPCQAWSFKRANGWY